MLRLLEFQALSYAFALFLCTVAYFFYMPVRPYSANLIFDFIGGADLACVLDFTAVGGAGLDHVLGSAAVGGINLTIIIRAYSVSGAGLDYILDSVVIDLAAQYGNTNLS